MKAAYTFCFILFFLTGLFAQDDPGNDSPLSIGKSYRIHPSNATQSEAFIVKSPLDQNTMFITCNTILFVPFFISEGVYVTTDGGNTWSGNDTCTGNPIGFHGGDPGIAIDKNGTFILTHKGRTPFNGLYSHYSNDHGQIWSSQLAISTHDLERAALAPDVNPASSWFGRTYAGWTELTQPFPMVTAYTDNGGLTWSTPLQVNNPTHRCAGGDMAAGPDGKVYACWAGVTETSPFKEILVGFASSSTGGTSWNVNEDAFAVNGITGLLPDKNNIRVNGLPSIAVDTNNGPRRGWIYIVTGQKDLSPAGSDPDIIMYRSTDGGVTWSAGIRVNQDPLNNGKTQYFPNIHIDKFGAIDVIFYDDRNTTTDSSGVYLARSFDGGNTWREYEISDHHFKPAPIGGLGQGYQGDIIDLTSNDTRIWPVWMDNYTGIYQLWTVPINYSDVNGIEENNYAGSADALKQNYPNPFHASTRIGYRVSAPGYVSLKILDILGNEITELVNETKSPGYYEAEFDPARFENNIHLSSRIYFYRLTMHDKVETRRMIYLK